MEGDGVSDGGQCKEDEGGEAEEKKGAKQVCVAKDVWVVEEEPLCLMTRSAVRKERKTGVNLLF